MAMTGVTNRFWTVFRPERQRGAYCRGSGGFCFCFLVPTQEVTTAFVSVFSEGVDTSESWCPRPKKLLWKCTQSCKSLLKVAEVYSKSQKFTQSCESATQSCESLLKVAKVRLKVAKVPLKVAKVALKVAEVHSKSQEFTQKFQKCHWKLWKSHFSFRNSESEGNNRWLPLPPGEAGVGRGGEVASAVAWGMVRPHPALLPPSSSSSYPATWTLPGTPPASEQTDT